MTVLAGQIATAEDLNNAARTRVRRGYRTTASSTTTTEAEVLRVDGVPLKAGRSYMLHTSSLLVQSTVANDVVVAKIRMSTTGTATIASSTDMGEGARRVTAASQLEETSAALSYTPSADETASVLLTVVRASGTGSASIYGAANAPIELFVDDASEDPGNTGVSL